MGERRGHPEAGWVIGLVALVGTLVLAFLSWMMFTHPFATVAAGCIAPGPCPGDPHPNVWGGVLCAVLAGGCFVGGLWLSWRVGTGYWGRGARAGMRPGMAERRGHPVAAAFISLITLLVVVVVFLLVLWWSEWGQSALAAAVCLVFGLWLSWRVGTGHWSLRRRPDEPPPPPA